MAVRRRKDREHLQRHHANIEHIRSIISEKRLNGLDVGLVTKTAKAEDWASVIALDQLWLDTLFLAVFDGHNGPNLAREAGSSIAEALETAAAASYSDSDVQANDFVDAAKPQASVPTPRAISRKRVSSSQLARALKVCNERLKANSVAGGSTALLAAVSADTDEDAMNVAVANLGDSRAVAFNKDGFQQLSVDHSTANDNEVERVKAAGGFITMGRLFGQLELTRGLGDFTFRPYLLDDADTAEKRVDANTTVVLASDGLWGVVSNEQIADKLSTLLSSLAGQASSSPSEAASAQHVADQLLQLALDSGSRDDITIFVVRALPPS